MVKWKKKTKKKKEKKKDKGKKDELVVKQIVISALLEALNDLLGKDGKDSIVKFAGLGDKYLSKNLRPSLVKSLPKSDLVNLSKAMIRLLSWGSKAILLETGRNFAKYLTPFGYSLDTIAEKLKKWIEGDWEIQIERNEETLQIKILNDPFHTKKPESGCAIWTGFFEIAATNSSDEEGLHYKASFITPETIEEKCSIIELKQIRN
ncbi:MAG: hypothetical protein ACFFCS_14785 [Candidatus Hodarchaeota archaeon]